MSVDLVYLKDELLVSKKTADWKVWQEKLYYYKASLAFEDAEDILEFMRDEYNLTGEQLKPMDNALDDAGIQAFLLDFEHNSTVAVEVKKTAIDILGGKGELVYWEEWSWALRKVKVDLLLWVYLGGIADICREIRLNAKQKSLFLDNGRPYIVELATELQMLKSKAYDEAIKEGRRIQ